MTALLHASSCGVHASRRIARGCAERLDFLAGSGLQRPDLRSSSDCRQRHLQALGGLCDQVLRLGREAGWERLGHAALDGTRLKANASTHKAMSSGRMVAAETAREAGIAAGLERVAQADAVEDGAQGAARRGTEMPSWAADKQQRLARIREAKAALDA